MKSKLLAGANVLLMALGASATAAYAQDNTAVPAQDSTKPSADRLIDEIVVTARRKEESLQSVPVAVTALTSEDLDERGIADVADLQGAVPTLTFSGRSSQAGRKGLTFALRGLRSSAVTTYSSEIVRSPQAVGDFYDLQAVEVAKGPQGTLFGSNSTAGAVIFRPATPSDEFEGSISARAGNYSMYGGTAVLNLPLGDAAALRIALDGEDREGIVSRPTGDDLDSDKHFGGRVSFRVSPTDGFQNLFVVEGYSHDATGPYFFPLENRPCNGNTQASCFYTGSPVILGFIPPATFITATLPNIGPGFAQAQLDGPFRSRQTTEPYISYRQFAAANITDIDVGPVLGDSLGNVSLRSIFGYTEDTQRSFLDFDGFQERILDASVQSLQKSSSFEGQIRGERNDGALNWVLGVFYRDVETTADNQTTVFNESALVRRLFNGRTLIDAENRAIYGQASWEFIDNVTLTAGYRTTQIDLAQNNRSTQNGACFAALPSTPGAYDIGVGGTGTNACGRIQTTTFEEPSWTLGLDWQVDPDTLLYVVTRRGFAQGGFNNINPPLDTFQPEILTDVEVGLKRDWEFDGAELRTNVAIFHNDYKDVQRNNSTFVAGTGPGTGNIAFTSNAAAATLIGAELEAELAFQNGLAFRLSAARVDAEYDKYLLVIPPATTPIDVSRNEVAQAPEWSGTVGVDYHTDISGLGTFSATVDYNYQDTIYFQDVNLTNQALSNTLDASTTQKAYGIWNARVGIANIFDSNVSVDIWGRNIGDKLYYVQKSNSGTLGLSNGQPGLPQMFGATIRAAF